MALLKFGHAAVATPMVCPGKWVDKKVVPGRIKLAKDVIAKYDPSKWLLSHCSIMASVDVDQADPKDPKSDYLIKPEYSIFVNNNGDSWERELLRKASKTFLGADNFCEHVQLEALSKGKVIDVALRDVPFTKDKDGKDLTTLYVDILIATDRKHKDLVDKIGSGEYAAVSMGCSIMYSICSQCGRKIEDETQACKHIRYFKNNSFYDENGDMQKTYVDEDYPLNDVEAASVVWIWLSEWYETTKLADDIYVRMGPRPVQFRSMDNPSKCHPGIVGNVFNTFFNE
jgi:hypothetical protein